MLFNRFFFDAAPGEPAGGVATEPSSAAAAMATSGRVNDGSPLSSGDTSSSTPPGQAQQAAIAQPPAQGTPPATPPTPPAAQAAPPATEPPAPPDWRTVLKAQPSSHVLKELGYDDSMVGLLNEWKQLDPKMQAFFQTWKSNGDIKPYFEALNTDFSKMAAEDMLRQQLRMDYPKLEPAQREALAQDLLVEKYKQNADLYPSEEERARGKRLLDADASKWREAALEQQQKYFIPKAPDATQAAEVAARQQQQETELFNTTFVNSQPTQRLLQSKQLTIGEGAEAFNYPVADPQDMVRTWLEPDAWVGSLFIKGADGSMAPDIDKQLFLGAAAKDWRGLAKALIDHGKTLGGRALSNSLENPSQPGAAPAGPDNSANTPSGQMAAKGRLTPGYSE
jgi:hypothetical protein